MACPYFYPVAARAGSAMLPLGDWWTVRFTISSHDSAAIGLYFVVERNHHPFAHGRLEYSIAAAAFLTSPESATLARQAQAYVESYVRRKKES